VRPEAPGECFWTWFILLYWMLTIALGYLFFFICKSPLETGLVLVSLSVALIVAEITVRSLFPLTRIMPFQMANSLEFQHISTPNATMYMTTPDMFVTLIRTNEDGLRTDYSRSDFRNFKDRIVVLGDSFTFGPRATQEGTFPQATERLLRERLARNDLAVLNAGVGSYSPFLEDLLYTGLIREHYAPTCVVLFLDVTDFGDDLIYAKQATYRNGRACFFRRPQHVPGHICALQELFRPHSNTLINALRYPFLLIDANCLRKNLYIAGDFERSRDFRYYDFDVMVNGMHETNRYFIYRHPLPSIEPYLRNTLRIIDGIAAKAKEDGATFTLFVLPRYQHWNRNECADNWEVRDGYYNALEPYEDGFLRFFDEIKPSLSYDVVNLLPAFRDSDETGLVFSFDPHWTDKGHALVARVLADYLANNYFTGN